MKNRWLIGYHIDLDSNVGINYNIFVPVLILTQIIFLASGNYLSQ